MTKPKGAFVLTGSNGGLGVATMTRFLASQEAKEYKGIFTVRNPVTAAAAKKALNDTAHPARHEIIPLDISTLAGVRAGAGEINRRVQVGELPPIRALVLNAAIQDGKGQVFTDDGFESHFGVNYLANFVLVLLLLQSMDKDNSRIIIVSSWSHDPRDSRNEVVLPGEGERSIWQEPATMAYEKVQDPMNALYPAGYKRYGRSKTLIIMFMYELQRRLQLSPSLSNISVLAVDPGGMPNTGMIKDASWFIRFAFHQIIGSVISVITWLQPNGTYRSTWKSAGDLLAASFDEKKYGKHPQALYLDGSRKAESGSETKDEQKQKALWNASIKMANINAADTVLENWQ